MNLYIQCSLAQRLLVVMMDAGWFPWPSFSPGLYSVPWPNTAVNFVTYSFSSYRESFCNRFALFIGDLAKSEFAYYPSNSLASCFIVFYFLEQCHVSEIALEFGLHLSTPSSLNFAPLTDPLLIWASKIFDGKLLEIVQMITTESLIETTSFSNGIIADPYDLPLKK